MPKRKHSIGVTPEQHAELMKSVDARDNRRQEYLKNLPVNIGNAIKGRVREEYKVSSPPVIPKDMVISLGKRLARIGTINRDQFTANIPILTSKMSYDQYTMGGNKNNKRTESELELAYQSVFALQRQTQIIADKVNHDAWQEWQLARLRFAGVAHVLKKQRQGKSPETTALGITAGAFEDFGFSLQESASLGKLMGRKWLPKSFIEIGQYASNEPRSLLAQHGETILVVQREQERREAFWHDTLVHYEDPMWGGDRRTEQDQLDEIQNNALIAQLTLK